MDKKIIQDHVDEINGIIYDYLPEADKYTEELAEAMSYSVEAGGKRLRPLFLLEMYRTFANGREEPEILHAMMAATEFIHTYSLIHDDLPAMDNDDFRRGLPTTHSKYGEAQGILAGDALLNLAYETIFDSLDESSEPDDFMNGISAARVLAEKAGIYGMVGGQYMDVYSEKHPEFEVDQECLKFIYENKTSALLEASMMAGAILGGANDLEVRIIEKMGRYIGMAFQIRDDILDVTGDQDVIGKPVGSDEKNEKTTYVSLMGIPKAQMLVQDFTDKALEIFDSLKYKNNFLREMILELAGRVK